MDLESEARAALAISMAESKPCELCGAGKQDDTLILEDGSIKHICRLCHDTHQLTHRRMVLHCFNRILDQLRKLG